MTAIYKKELRSYLNSFVGWLFIAVILFFMGLYCTINNLVYGYPYYSYVISGCSFVFLISIPVLCMRILTEERHNRTDQLILTAPVSVGGIVLGKFLALSTILAIPTLITCAYPLILTKFGDAETGGGYLAILAFYLYGIACIAVCMFLSSFTESQVIAAVLGFGVLFVGFMINSVIAAVSASENFLTKVLGFLDMSTPFSELLNGTLEMKAVVYFLSVAALMLFLTVQSIQKRRYSVSVKHLSTGAYSCGMIAVALAVTVIVNLIVGEMPSTWTSVDMTAQKLYSLTSVSKEYVKNLTEDVEIYAIVNENNADVMLSETLERFDDLSEHISVEYIDPTLNPTFHQQYTDSNISMNSLIVVSEKRSRVIDYSEIYQSTYDSSTGAYVTSGYDGEGLVTGAIAYVTSETSSVLYATEGHGEYALSETYISGISKQNMEHRSINLMDYETVPEDASCLLINGPTSDFSKDDKDKVIAYLEKGGTVLLTVGYTDTELVNVEEILELMGMSIVDGMIVEQNSNYYYQSEFFLLPEMTEDEFTAGVKDEYYAFTPYAKGIVIEDEENEDFIYNVFMKSSSDAFSKMDMSNTEDLSMKDEDAAGPFNVGVEARKALTLAETDSDGEDSTQTLEMQEATLVVVGTDYFITDEANSMVGGSNQLIFNNMIGTFSDYEVSVSVPVKDYTVSYLMASAADIVIIGGIIAVVLPVSSLIIGFVIWYKRRKR